jgi:DNA anti-recombination protein RmuC
MNIKYVYVADFSSWYTVRLSEIEVKSETEKTITIAKIHDIISGQYFNNRIEKRAHNIFETKEAALDWLKQKATTALLELQKEIEKIDECILSN